MDKFWQYFIYNSQASCSFIWAHSFSHLLREKKIAEIIGLILSKYWVFDILWGIQKNKQECVFLWRECILICLPLWDLCILKYCSCTWLQIWYVGTTLHFNFVLKVLSQVNSWNPNNVCYCFLTCWQKCLGILLEDARIKDILHLKLRSKRDN